MDSQGRRGGCRTSGCGRGDAGRSGGRQSRCRPSQEAYRAAGSRQERRRGEGGCRQSGGARGLYDLGAIGGKTMREFDSLRVEAPKVYSAYEIKRLRLKEKASQAVFAAYLNTSVSTVQKWEIGDKKPSGLALKLLDLVERKGLKALG